MPQPLQIPEPSVNLAVHLFSWHIFSRKHVLNCSAADLHHNHVPLSCELLVEGHGPRQKGQYHPQSVVITLMQLTVQTSTTD